jgi:hypothetical protein
MLVALLPLMLIDPFIGFAVGLIFFIAFLTLGALLIQSIADVLALITDAFDHYDGDAPEENAAESESDQLPADPVDCSLTREQLLKVVYADGEVDAGERGMLQDCGISAETANTLTLLADWASFLISAAELGWIAGMTLWGCLTYMELGLFGCAIGFTIRYEESLIAGTAATVLVSIVPPVASCMDDQAADPVGCFSGVITTALTSRIPNPFLNVAWNVFSYCNDRGYLEISRCLSELSQG